MPLAKLTTLRVGGPPRSLAVADSQADLIEAVLGADAEGEPVLLVGGGSNLLVADEGFAGRVIQVGTTGIEVEPDGRDHLLVRIEAGQPWDELVATAVDSGWSGLEALSGIPGSTGATPIQNVGAYGAEVSQVVAGVLVLDRHSGRVTAMTAGEAGFGYRTSALKQNPNRWVVLALTLRLPRSEQSAPIRYAELARALGVDVDQRAPAAAVRAAVLELRRSKGMVLDPLDHDTWSAGSFFTNPILSPAQAETLPLDAPRFAQPDGRVKTSAAWLISNSGFARGYAVRPGAPAALSSKHSLALTNRGTASARDLLELARAVRAGVAQRFGLVLVNEPVLVGCEL